MPANLSRRASCAGTPHPRHGSHPYCSPEQRPCALGSRSSTPARRPRSRRARCPAGARRRCGPAAAAPPPPAPGWPPTARPAGTAPCPVAGKTVVSRTAGTAPCPVADTLAGSNMNIYKLCRHPGQVCAHARQCSRIAPHLAMCKCCRVLSMAGCGRHLVPVADTRSLPLLGTASPQPAVAHLGEAVCVIHVRVVRRKLVALLAGAGPGRARCSAGRSCKFRGPLVTAELLRPALHVTYWPLTPRRLGKPHLASLICRLPPDSF